MRKSSEIRQIDPELAVLGGMLPSILNELEHYRDNPRLLIIVSCTFVELMVATLLEAHCKRGAEINRNSRDFPLAVRLTLLLELDLITEAEFKALNWLRKRRNDAAHRPGFAFNKSHMPDWTDPVHDAPGKLFSLLVNLIGVFWNIRVDLFREMLPLSPLDDASGGDA